MGNSLGHLTEESTLSASIANKLPNEILLEILYRVSLEDLPSILFVCRQLSKLVSDPNFLRIRLLPTLHVFNFFYDNSTLSSASVALNTLQWSPTTYHQLPSFGKYRVPLVSLGRSVYIISRQGVLRYDTWMKTTAPIAPTLFSCDLCSPVAINGKIYVCGDAAPTAFIEEYDPVADKWRVVTSHSYRVHNSRQGVGAGRVFYILNPGNPGSMEGYDVCSGQWVEGMPARLPRGTGFLAGACGTPSGHVYIITNLAMEFRFWRWEGIGMEWVELEAPAGIKEEWIAMKEVVTEEPEEWESVRVSCVAVRDERVVAVVNVLNLLLGDRPPGWDGWVILTYSVADGSWTRGWDIPIELRNDPSLAFTEY